VRLIDVLEGSGVGIDWYAAKIRQREYAYADHAWPHDGGHRNIRDIGGTSLEANAKALGVRPIRVLERDPSIQTGIQAVRQMFPLLEFNTRPLPFDGETQDEASARMTRAMDALRQYRRVWDEKNQRMSDAPLHDWTSNTADSLRTLARGRRPFYSPSGASVRPARAISDDD
jgi:phage terminase large subunit